jgi:hypothetical protein
MGQEPVVAQTDPQASGHPIEHEADGQTGPTEPQGGRQGRQMDTADPDHHGPVEATFPCFGTIRPRLRFHRGTAVVDRGLSELTTGIIEGDRGPRLCLDMPGPCSTAALLSLRGDRAGRCHGGIPFLRWMSQGDGT